MFDFLISKFVDRALFGFQNEINTQKVGTRLFDSCCPDNREVTDSPVSEVIDIPDLLCFLFVSLLTNGCQELKIEGKVHTSYPLLNHKVGLFVCGVSLLTM